MTPTDLCQLGNFNFDLGKIREKVWERIYHPQRPRSLGTTPPLKSEIQTISKQNDFQTNKQRPTTRNHQQTGAGLELLKSLGAGCPSGIRSNK